MKKHLIYFVLISICIGCNNLQQEDEVISPSEKLQTKTSDHNKHLVTITTNLNEELILFPLCIYYVFSFTLIFLT